MPNIRQRYIALASFLFALGILFFLNNFKLLESWNFTVLFLLWPLILLILGAYFLLRGRKIASYLTSAWSFLLGLVIFAFFATTTLPFLPKLETSRKSTINPNIEIKSNTENSDTQADKANLIFKSERGNFTLRGTTDSLTEYESKSTFGEYIYTKSDKDGVTTADLRFSTERFPWKLTQEANSLDLKLNSHPKWNLDYDISTTSTLDMDLGYYKVDSFRLKLSSTTANLNFEESTFDNEINLEIDASAASTINFHIPKNVGIKIISKSFLSSTDFGDLKESSDKGTYTSENFDSAEKKLIINSDINLSTLKIDRF